MALVRILPLSLLLCVLALAPSAFAQTTFTNSALVACAANAGSTSPATACSAYPSNISVSGMAGIVTKVAVRLNNVSADRASDLIAVLVSPAGQNLVLWSDAGGPGAFTNVTVTLDDAGASLLPEGSVPATGTFRPTAFNSGSPSDQFPSPAPTAPAFAAPYGTATLASQFNGINPNGTWSLYVADDAAGPNVSGNGIRLDGGWSLILTVQAPQAPTTTTLTSSSNPSLTGGNVTITATVSSGGWPVTAGTVTFRDGAAVLASNVSLNASGQASFSTAALAEGTHPISASYSGATGFGASSASLTQVVNNATVVSGATFCNPGPLGVADAPAIGSVYPSRVFVSGLSGTVTKVILQLRGITAARPDDLDLLLVSPTGAKFVPVSDTGGLSSVADVTLTLDDSAANLLPDDQGWFTGTFRPTAVNTSGSLVFPAPAPAGPYGLAAPFGSATFGSTFNGVAPNGAWQLFAVDDASGGGTSTFATGWCLAFQTSADAATITTVQSSPNPSFTSGAGNLVTFTATVMRADTGQPVTSGSVTFTEGGTVLAGPVALNSSGQASFATAALSEGRHVVTATYSGAAGINVSSGSVSQVVNNPTTVIGTTYCNPGPLEIRDSGAAVQYPARLFVSGLTAPILGVKMTLAGANLPRPDDVDVLLVGPTGAMFMPFSDVGGSTGISGVDLVMDDAAASLLPDEGPLVSGAFRPGNFNAGFADVFPAPAPASSPGNPYQLPAPSGGATFASVFGNSDANGTWQVFVSDDSVGGGTGAFTGGVCLTFVTAPTQYQLTTAVSPAGSGTISPATGLFDEGEVVPVSASAAAGYTFAGFSGALTGTATPQSLTIDQPLSVTANFSPLPTTLRALFTSKVGTTNARVWTVTLSNIGSGAAVDARITGLTLTQTFGAACSPVVLTPMPVPVGTLAPGASATGTVTIDFTGCVATARFRTVTSFSANDGSVSGSTTLYNQFR